MGVKFIKMNRIEANTVSPVGNSLNKIYPIKNVARSVIEQYPTEIIPSFFINSNQLLMPKPDDFNTIYVYICKFSNHNLKGKAFIKLDCT